MYATPSEWVKRVCSAPWKVRNSAPSWRMRRRRWNSRVLIRSMTSFSRSLSKPIDPWTGSRRYLLAKNLLAGVPSAEERGRRRRRSDRIRHPRTAQGKIFSGAGLARIEAPEAVRGPPVRGRVPVRVDEARDVEEGVAPCRVLRLGHHAPGAAILQAGRRGAEGQIEVAGQLRDVIE